ncbi:Isochorismate pyruvate lyase [Enterobacterales bacterium 8AC]|nr:Isochorismate pyruvate lyase [Enterobacterales bacterium 8AC]
MNTINKLPPQACTSIDEIRAEIDMMDEQIIKLLAQRFQYVKAAAKFKTSPDAVRAKARFDAMIQTRRQWASENGLSPDVIENLYTQLVNYFISEELKHWSEEQENR